jgi:hypothetical protein
MVTYFGQADDTGLALAKKHFGDLYDFGELRLGRWYAEKK